MRRFRHVSVFLVVAWLFFFEALVVDAQSLGNSIESPASADDRERLETLQTLIEANASARKELRVAIGSSAVENLPELQRELDALTQDSKKLRESFEQVAIGSIDTSVLEAIDTSFDWRGEVTQIIQPIVENLKSLTDKPRKINQLLSLIEQNTQQSQAIEDALVSIDSQLNAAEGEGTRKSLSLLLKSWQRHRDDNQQELSVARNQLAELQNSDVTWGETVRQSSAAFFKGRGLTLFLALLVVAFIWLSLRGLLWLLQRGSKNINNQELRTRRRLAQYAYNALILLLMLIAAMSVFYVRGDMLLMGLSILAAAGIALGVRHGVPRIVAEAKLLLNLGDIREKERVIYNGLPWQVASLNLYSILKNPELNGVIRLPLSELRKMISRPASKELWFPSRKGDFILLEDERLLEVISQTPEMVELRDRGGTLITVPTADYYGWSFRNLSRSDTFGVASAFGVDYKLQSLSLTTVPKRLSDAIVAALDDSEFAPYVVSVVVELSAAGNSSLDYWMYVSIKREAAKGYAKIQRLMQQACIDMCTREEWDIPFPHLTVHRYEADPMADRPA